MDWELIVITVSLIYGGLVVSAVSALGFTRPEKFLAMTFLISEGVAIILLSIPFVFDFPGFNSVAEFEAYQTRMFFFLATCNWLWWLACTAGGVFLVIGTIHTWQCRSILLNKLRPER